MKNSKCNQFLEEGQECSGAASMRTEMARLRVKAIQLLQRLEDGDDPQTEIDDLWNALGQEEESS